MAVYIKDMEMPKKCANCLLCDERTDRCAVTLKLIEEFCRVDDDCPLVAVPEHELKIDVPRGFQGRSISDGEFGGKGGWVD